MKYDVVLLPSFSQVEHWRKQHVRLSEQGLFSQTVTTFNAWITDLWELHGDGRGLVDSLQRRVIMQAAFEQLVAEEGDDVLEAFDGNCGPAAQRAEAEQDAMRESPKKAEDGSAGPLDCALTLSPGVVKMAASCVRAAAGVPAFERAVAQAGDGHLVEGLTPRESLLLMGIARYNALLERAGLVELGWAASFIAQAHGVVFPRGASVLLANAAPLDWQRAHFFDECDNLQVDIQLAPGSQGIGTADPALDVSFAFPSGRYAQPALALDLVSMPSEAGNAAVPGQGAEQVVASVIAAKDPLSLYKHIEQQIAKRGFSGSVIAQVPFHSTDFGRNFMSLCRVLHENPWSSDDLSDALRPPFAGLGTADVLEVDRALRLDRIADRTAYLDALCRASDTFSQLEDLADDPEADILLGVFEQIAFNAKGRSDAWRAEQLSAAAALRSCTAAARRVGVGMKACLAVLEDVAVRVSFESGLPEGGLPGRRVIVTTQAAAAQMGAASCEQLVVCDLTSDDYPVADKGDAAETLFGKLGLHPTDSSLSRARRTFAALQSLPSKSLVLMRPLNDWDGNPTYPSAPLQEFVDAYRPDPSSTDDLDEMYQLPECFLASMHQRGEEWLYANAAACAPEKEQPLHCSVKPSGLGHVPSESKPLVALERSVPEGQEPLGFCPSPSQVETYLECPYRWFAQSRLRIETLGEEFGALERGSFAHGVLQEFYVQAAQLGWRKVNESNLEQAKRLMRSVADAQELMQADKEPGSGRYVAANQIERRQVSACKEQLVNYLDFEAQMLPGFHPQYLEFAISGQEGVLYAGRPFVGMVDRIDVDDKGNAVILDYKGSIGPAHEIAGKDERSPGKIQTRMYAQVVKRMLGLNVVGALYVCYGRNNGLAGAYDARVLESAHLPGMRHDKCRCAVGASPAAQGGQGEALVFANLTFDEMLDQTERLVGDTMDAMQEGVVEPRPATPDACVYCPISTCPKRGA